MEDISARAEDSLTISSMAAGNMTSTSDGAMTAPGSRPVDPLPGERDDPRLDEIHRDYRQLERGEGSEPGAHSWDEVSGQSWGPR
jgi:hypothetical protein